MKYRKKQLKKRQKQFILDGINKSHSAILSRKFQDQFSLLFKYRVNQKKYINMNMPIAKKTKKLHPKKQNQKQDKKQMLSKQEFLKNSSLPRIIKSSSNKKLENNFKKNTHQQFINYINQMKQNIKYKNKKP